MKFKKPAIFTTLTLAAGSALAEVPTEVTDAMGDMKSDAIAVAAAFLVAIIAVAAFKLMRRGAG